MTARFEAYGSTDGSVTVVDTKAATTVAHLLDLQQLNAGNQYPFTFAYVTGVHFSNDGERWLAAAAWSGAARAHGTPGPGVGRPFSSPPSPMSTDP